MTSYNSIVVMVAATLITFLSTTEGFFLYSNKKSSNERLMPPPNNFYRESMQVPSNNWGGGYSFEGTGPVTVALPVAVPIQAQMAPVPPTLKGTVHNVQLVPCLCPVSKDVDANFYGSPQQLQGQQQQSSTGYVVQSQPSNVQTT